MNIGALTSSDTMYNFVKLVDAARQRNISAFEDVATKVQRTQGKSNAAQVSAFQQTFTKNKPVEGVDRPQPGYQLPKVTRTKILGNFFDAYA
jgi:hypothetical protein